MSRSPASQGEAAPKCRGTKLVQSRNSEKFRASHRRQLVSAISLFPFTSVEAFGWRERCKFFTYSHGPTFLGERALPTTTTFSVTRHLPRYINQKLTVSCFGLLCLFYLFVCICCDYTCVHVFVKIISVETKIERNKKEF